MSTSILATKLYIPPAQPKVVLRPRLIERLNEGLHHKLTLISAPAGFGKTTLVSEWVAGCDRREPKLRVAWLSLDEGDNDTTRFLIYLVAAMQTIAPTIGQSVLGMLQSSQPPPPEFLLTTLLNEITPSPDNPSTRFASGQSFVLVLDDYHVIDSKLVDHALTFLIEHQPPQMHLVIATREDPQLPLAQLRVRGQLTELRAADLRFSPAEAPEFLNRVMGLNLSAEDVAALETRTEGWIAGLQLAAISMQGLDDTTRFIQSFTGSHRFVMDYLVEQVLGQQSESVQQFLLRTSMLDHMCGPLCDAVLLDSSVSGQATLEYLEHANLFIVPLDSERHWYRYHHLFRDLLRRRLELTWLAQVPVLHQRASEWYRAAGLVEQAMGHAFASQDLERVAALIDEFADELNLQMNQVLLKKWMERLPHALIRTRPWLCVYEGWVRYWTGQRAQVEESLRNAELALESSTRNLSDEERKHIAGHIAAIRAHHALTDEALPRVLEMGQTALELLPEADHMRCEAAVAMGGAYWGLGNSAASQQHFYLAKTIGLKHGQRALAVSAACYTSMMQVKRGLVADAFETLREALDLATGPGGEQFPIAGFANVKLGDLLREQNDLEKASQQIVQAVDQCIQLGQADVLTDSYVTLARLRLALDDLEGAREAIQKADEVARRVKIDPFVFCWLQDCHVRLWLADEDMDAIVRWVEQSGLTVNDPLSYHYDLHHINLARVLVARGMQPDALQLLDRLMAAAESAGWVHEMIKIAILQALALQAKGETHRVPAALSRALTLAEPRGYMRIFVDEGAPMRLMILDLRVSILKTSPHLCVYLEKLLAAFHSTTAENPKLVLSKIEGSKIQGLVEALSQRELEVLRLIAQGLSNREIGERLFLALSTVKGHSRIIFDKLEVHNRTEAVARARELGLL
ncbi:MAG: LuxR family transcriptional regulator [Chloroflexi bacterium]|nr:LuxR family transcriptional regulator [Chloroflexota bacterium]